MQILGSSSYSHLRSRRDFSGERSRSSCEMWKYILHFISALCTPFSHLHSTLNNFLLLLHVQNWGWKQGYSQELFQIIYKVNDERQDLLDSQQTKNYWRRQMSVELKWHWEYLQCELIDSPICNDSSVLSFVRFLCSQIHMKWTTWLLSLDK